MLATLTVSQLVGLIHLPVITQTAGTAVYG